MYLRSVLVNVSVLIPTVYSAILGNLRPAFVNPLPPARGSCSVDQLQELKIGFREAIDATKKAAQAIDNLKNSAPNSLIHKDKNRTWKRQAQLLKALFNIDVDKKLGDGNNDANLLQNAMDYRFPNLANKYWLFCGDNWLQWRAATATNENDSHEPKRTVGFFNSGQGMYLGQASTPTMRLKRYVHLDNAAPAATHPMCVDQNHAVTTREVPAITFCPIAWGRDSLAETKRKIRPGDALGEKLTLAHLWIHELAHLILNFLDEPAVDGSGRPIPGAANGWQRGAALARHEPARARQAPDLYALFATTVYLDNFGWGTGVAEK
ncbi:MAG: hypothetical protein Q9198_000666 [Flavoplaca austrocitrina]